MGPQETSSVHAQQRDHVIEASLSATGSFALGIKRLSMHTTDLKELLVFTEDFEFT